MITRDEAFETIFKVMHEGFTEQSKKQMCEIAQCIMMENVGWHMWGLSDEEVKTLTTIAEPDAPEYDAHIKRQLEISDRITFKEGVE